MKKLTDVLGDMDGLEKVIHRKLKKVETKLGMVKLDLSGKVSTQKGSTMTKIKVSAPKAYGGE